MVHYGSMGGLWEMIFYDNISDDLSEVRDQILEEFLMDFPDIRNSSRKLAFKAVNCVLYNVSRNVLQGERQFPITLNKQAYSNGMVVNGKRTNRKLSHTWIRNFVDWLCREKGCELEVGGVRQGIFNPSYSQSVFTCSDWLVGAVSKAEVRKTSFEPLDNVVILRDEDKKPMTFRLNPELREIIDNLQQYNILTKQAEVVLEDQGKSYDLQLMKIYNNGSFESGGRLYLEGGSVQQLSNIDRKALRISSEPVCELDYAYLHPSIIGELTGHPMEGHDPYGIGIAGYHEDALRRISKVALLIMINCKSLPVAKKALNFELARSFDVQGMYEEGLIPAPVVDVGRVLFELESHNQFLTPWLYSGQGLRLQNMDSRMADYVVAYFTQRGEVVIPIHDSFIVRQSLREELRGVMVSAYEHVLGTSVNCKVEEK